MRSAKFGGLNLKSALICRRGCVTEFHSCSASAARDNDREADVTQEASARKADLQRDQVHLRWLLNRCLDLTAVYTARSTL